MAFITPLPPQALVNPLSPLHYITTPLPPSRGCHDTPWPCYSPEAFVNPLYPPPNLVHPQSSHLIPDNEGPCLHPDTHTDTHTDTPTL